MVPRRHSGRRWQTVAADPASVQTLAATLGIPPAAARILVARGYAATEAAGRFLRPELGHLSGPFSLPGSEAASRRLMCAIRRREPIAVFGDYDADGITATALTVSVLQALGGAATPFLPCRFRDGYGLTATALRRCLASLRPTLLVTVDCGITAVDAVAEARAAGVDVIVTDHHAPGPLPPAADTVHPAGAPDASARPLAGVGVAFKLCHALVKQAREAGDRGAQAVDLRAWLDWVAVGTVGDVVPLQGDNRILVHHGLRRLNERPSVGLAALKETAGLRRPAASWHLAFLLAPRLNAAGRMQDAQPALDLLLARDESEARRLAAELESHNTARREEENGVLEEAVRLLEARAAPEREFGLVVAGSGWHEGILGIVAARLVERYGRPAVVISIPEHGPARGSARSIAGVDLLGVLEQCRTTLGPFGGHAAAAGVSLEPSALPEFARRFDAACAGRLRGQDLRPTLDIDAWVEMEHLDEDLWGALQAMEPFGVGNPEPVLAVRGATLAAPPRVVGRRHLKMVLEAGGGRLDAIGFRMADREVPPGPLDVAFTLGEDDYGGRRALLARVRDFRPHC